MRIDKIFADIYSVKYDDQALNEFRRLFSEWTDPEYLESFFETHKQDLESDFYENLSVEDAIYLTIDDAGFLRQKMIEFAKNNKSDDFKGLFMPLHQMEKNNTHFSDRKAYGGMEKSWLRIYAIKTTDGVYIITGGTIKLTRTMQERAHTNLELGKMQRCKDFLKEEGMYDHDAFIDLEF